MADLKNEFSWSFSQARDFSACPRKYYWQRYGSWGGWEEIAPNKVKTAYRLKQMKNRYALVGLAVDKAVKEALARIKAGEEVTFEEANKTARDHLVKAWYEHKSKMWEKNPKKYTCIKDLYYSEFLMDDEESRQAWGSFIKERLTVCLENFFGMILPKIRPYLERGELVPIGQGDFESDSFAIGGLKIFAAPDSVIKTEDTFLIIDWKTGKPQQYYDYQVRVYGIWAQMKHDVPADMIELALAYLPDGTWKTVPYDEDIAREAFDFIRENVEDMSDKLKGRDIALNEPLNMKEFEQTDRLETCAQCNFMELCQRQFALASKEQF